MRLAAGCCAILGGLLVLPTASASPPAGVDQPYLASGSLPSGAAMLPPPPAPGSPAAILDGQLFQDNRAVKQRDPARWARLAAVVSPAVDRLPGMFACALGMDIGPATARVLNRLLDRTARTIAPQVEAAQKHFARRRPYLHNHQPICVPRFTRLDHSPSYPSGSAALAWSASLILAELAPERAAPVLARSRALGEARVVCGVDHLSDVQAGAIDAAGLVAVLHSSAAFRADLQQAGAALTAARGHATRPADGDACAREPSVGLDPSPTQP